MTALAARTQTVAFVSLGCAKNLVDSEVMIAKLGAAGWTLVPEAGDADAVVINTCAFIDPAKAESTETILEHAARKRDGQQLIVAGCLSQRFGEELQSLIPEIDGVIGTGAYASIAELLDDAIAGRKPVRLGFEAEPEHDFLPRLVTTPAATAYLKIAEGCDHPCTFCIIPQLRGAFRSRSAESILAEAHALAAGGVKELILIAQDTSMWGRDRGFRRGGLAELLRRLHDVERNRVDPAALPVPGDRRLRVDRRDGVLAQGVRVHGHAAAAREQRGVARDAATVARRTLLGDHRRLPPARPRDHDALDLHRRVSG